MATVINIQEIQSIVKDIDIVSAIEEGFIQYSNGNTIVPPVGELLFEKPKGEAHIKYGYIKNDEYYVIKIASGFYDNPALGIPSSQGLMLLFNQKTGQLVAVLLDEGYLTDIRTAAAGAVAAKYFAPKNIKAIGIVGTGIQARLQLQYLQKHTPCKTVWVWGRNMDKVHTYISEMGDIYDFHIATNITEIARNCNLIVTTTPATTPLLMAQDIQSGTHITAVGSDTEDKQELDSELLKNADLIIADSIPQSKTRGEIYHARKTDAITNKKIVELGTAIQDTSLQRMHDQQITVTDLTGVAVQDIMIAKAVYMNYNKN
ncbi:hypothetical protein [Aquimarina sp. 2201CG14-23]|uniref:hypothetical protein n=1 Tax=Aquimarina mycalae TaxID=3040073 RepID=UPI002477FB9A|nr:hypothetical protein [Aquimarina sp. 2201CG14-23]MDH7448175.1 hypothetical protein [Aquimarina sp. 2201CG14-23]